VVSKIKLMKKYIILSFIIVFAACRQTSESVDITAPYETPKTATGKKGIVVSAHPEATKVGLEILKKGGNATDAAIAVQLTLAVVYQRAGNIGGGGFMVHRSAEGEVTTLDYREKAPLAAHKDMYLDSAGNVIDGLSVYGHLAAGVPGTVAGLLEAYEQKGGKLPFADLISPAIELAENGFLMTEKEAKTLNEKIEDIKKYNTTMPILVKNEPWKIGDKLIQKDLAETLKRIRKDGKAGFYEGETADLIVAEMKAGGGIITHEDLKKYQAVWRKPITFEYDDYTISSMPPPSSGGICLASILGMIEPLPLNEYGFHDVRSIHAIVEAERRAYSDRAEYIGDSDFYDVPVAGLIDEKYLTARMADFSPTKATSSEAIEAGKPRAESEQTTHLSIVDAEGNAVSVTTTLNTNFGSKVVVSGAGFFLNNEMDDFSAKAGVPNFYGLVGNEANSVQPQKRMLSSMTPTIVAKNGRLFMVVGTPGGSTIITTVLQVFLNVAEYGMTVEEAVNAKRFHHQWLPDQIFVEEGFDKDTITALEKLGHKIEMRDVIGKVEAIVVTADGTYEGAADIRGDDTALGY
jgi:gamma-glutamyltranspeptidase/glutathione hydrolase